MDSRLTDLEIRLTHHEVTLQELNDVIVNQQRMIDGLTTEIKILNQRLHTITESNIANESEETPPPHY